VNPSRAQRAAASGLAIASALILCASCNDATTTANPAAAHSSKATSFPTESAAPSGDPTSAAPTVSPKASVKPTAAYTAAPIVPTYLPTAAASIPAVLPTLPPAPVPTHTVAPIPTPTVPVNGLCTQYPNPTMPPSTGAQTPSGFRVQMAGVTLAAASTSRTLTSAYTQFNNMTCTEYSHQYTELPPRFFYYDCVGFTGYAVRESSPVAWRTVRSVIGIRGGDTVPTPYKFETFMNNLNTTPQAGWQGVATIQNVLPGDVFAWQPTNSNGTVNTSAVGHSVIPLVKPRAIGGSNGTRWEVVVMDSTGGGHGPLDTRKPASPLSQRNAPITVSSGVVEASGLGIGTLALDTTAGGIVTGVEWNVGDQAEGIQFGAARATS
jgi:hypothetical protein